MIGQKTIPPPSSSAGRMGSGVEFLDEFLQLGGIDVANCPEFEALCVPTSNVESLYFVDLRCPEVPKAAACAMKRLITCIRRR